MALSFQWQISIFLQKKRVLITLVPIFLKLMVWLKGLLVMLRVQKAESIDEIINTYKKFQPFV